MSDDAPGTPHLKSGYFNPEDLRREKQLSREKDDADLRDGNVTKEGLRLCNGLFSGIDLSRATIRIDGGKKLRFHREVLARIGCLDSERGRADANALYRTAPIPAFGGRTAEQIVESGEGATLAEYLQRLHKR